MCATQSTNQRLVALPPHIVCACVCVWAAVTHSPHRLLVEARVAWATGLGEGTDAPGKYAGFYKDVTRGGMYVYAYRIRSQTSVPQSIMHIC